MRSSAAATYAFFIILLVSISGCAARPMASSTLQSAQVSMLSRTAAQLQKQLAALQAQTLAFTSAIASNNFKQRSPNPSAAAMPLMSGYHHLAAASAAERHAASIAAVAASISARTFQPAAAKGEHKTLLLKPDGSRFTKTFQWDGPASALDLAAASAALQPQKPNDYAAAATAQMGSLSSQQSACDGCIGADSRTAVPAATAKKFPYTAVGMLTADSPSASGSANAGSSWCTGVMVSPRHVLTAAHCVWDVDTAHAAKTNMKFAAGRNGAATPFGNAAYSAIRLLEQFQGQASYTDTAANTDFAVITLAKPVGKMTGWMGLTYSTAADEAVDITTAGFPDDKPLDTMWSTTCPRTMFHSDDPSNHVVEHNCDSTHGQSGSPMWSTDNNVRSVLTGGQGNGINWALRIDDFVLSTILGWMQEDGEFAGVGATVKTLNDVSGPAAAAASGGN